MQTAASMTLSLVCPCVFAVPAIHRVRGDWLWLWLNVALCECVVLHCLFCILLRFSVLYMWCQLACSVFLTRLPLADTFFFFFFYTGRETPIYLLVFFVVFIVMAGFRLAVSLHLSVCLCHHISLFACSLCVCSGMLS